MWREVFGLDTREPYLEGATGRPLAMVFVGPVGDLPRHEDYSHGADIPHQNPEVRRWWEIKKLFGIIPYGFRRMEMRHYGLTVAPDGRYADVQALQAAMDESDLGPHRGAWIAEMDDRAILGSLIEESSGQRGRGTRHINLNRAFGG